VRNTAFLCYNELMVDLLDFLFLPILFLIGLITGYQDFKEGKIKNKWIILGLVWGLGIYIFFLIWALVVPYTFILPSYIFKVFINSAIALVIGYLLWYFNLWSAGDAKLFFIFSLLLPLKYYWKTALPYFPSFALLINIFIPALLFLIGQNLFYFLKSISISKIAGFFSSGISKLKTTYPTFLKIFFGFFLIFITFQIIKNELANLFGQFGWWQASVLLLVIILRKSLNKVFQKNWFLCLFSLGIIFYLIFGYFAFSYSILAKLALLIRGSLFFMVIFMVASLLVSMFEESQKKHLPFAIWVMTGAIITMFLQSSLLSWLMQYLR